MVKLKSLALIVILAAAGAHGAADVSRWPDPATMTAPPLAWDVPTAERFTLANGLVVYLQADRELPLVNCQLICRTGSIYEPADKVGLAALTGTVMRTGGVAAPGRGLSGDDIDAALEARAASVEVGIGRESANAGASCLAADADYVLRLLYDVLVYPAFAPATGTPEVGGPSSAEALDFVRALTGVDFRGFDLVEVSPSYDTAGNTTALLAAAIAYDFLALTALRH